MLKIPGANGAIVKCVDPDLDQGLELDQNYHVVAVVIDGGGHAYLNVSRNGKIIENVYAQRFVNLEKLK